MEVQFDAAMIERYIPHRAPFRLVDRVHFLEPNVLARGEKDIRSDDPILAGHFPGKPIYPGVLILEALGQLGAIAVAQPVAEGENPSPDGRLFARIDRVRFVRAVSPGEVLSLEVKILKVFDGFVKAEGIARVGADTAASAELTFTTPK